MFDIEREQNRKYSQLCRLGFIFLAGALLIACVSSLIDLFGQFEQGPGLLARIQRSDWYQWTGTPITCGCFVGAILLWGRWEHASWQRRAGVFLLMNLADVVLWVMSRGDALGAQVGDFGHEWLRANVGMALGWGEFALLSSLTCDYLGHLGVEYARDSDKSTRSMAATGAMLWLLSFCQTTKWGPGWGAWPLQRHPIRGLEGRLLFHGFHLIWTITLIQVTALVISAVRQSTYVLNEMDREEGSHDLLVSQSEANHSFGEARPFRDEWR
jgi:hypothetical protein